MRLKKYSKVFGNGDHTWLLLRTTIICVSNYAGSSSQRAPTDLKVLQLLYVLFVVYSLDLYKNRFQERPLLKAHKSITWQ